MAAQLKPKPRASNIDAAILAFEKIEQLLGDRGFCGMMDHARVVREELQRVRRDERRRRKP